ncbi:hypothetical protein KSP39_PZI002877 [Platanthera zijinensis]|uniref:Reverse transcriptase n=1 Tax=Platanthera zijinensis TaxID=2320716 RepID=A0AAP0BZF4_9ASPA
MACPDRRSDSTIASGASPRNFEKKYSRIPAVPPRCRRRGTLGDDSYAAKLLTKEELFAARLWYFLGIEVTQDDHSLFICQRKYALELISDLGMANCGHVDSPLEPGEKSLHAESKLFDSPEKYHRIVGKLNYLTMTCPDIACAVSKVSQFMTTPTMSQWDSVLRIVRYVKRILFWECIQESRSFQSRDIQ